MKKIIKTSVFKNGFFSKDRFLISLFAIYALGIFIGTVAAASAVTEQNSALYSILNLYFSSRFNSSIASCFLEGATSSLIMMLFNFLLGLCALGLPFIYIIPAIDGIGKGLTVSFLCVNYGFIGILKSVILIIPQNALISFFLILSARQSVDMSRQLYSMLNTKNQCDKTISFKKFIQTQLIFLAVMLICCIIDAFLSRFSSFITG